jgi:hypothetical protein
MSFPLPKTAAVPSSAAASRRRPCVAASQPRKPAKPPYDRNAQLPKLTGLWPQELADCSVAGTERVIGLLRKALRSERQRGQAGHWTYDGSRHMALVEAMREETARLAILQRLPSRLPHVRS